MNRQAITMYRRMFGKIALCFIVSAMLLRPPSVNGVDPLSIFVIGASLLSSIISLFDSGADPTATRVEQNYELLLHNKSKLDNISRQLETFRHAFGSILEKLDALSIQIRKEHDAALRGYRTSEINALVRLIGETMNIIAIMEQTQTESGGTAPDRINGLVPVELRDELNEFLKEIRFRSRTFNQGRDIPAMVLSFRYEMALLSYLKKPQAFSTVTAERYWQRLSNVAFDPDNPESVEHLRQEIHARAMAISQNYVDKTNSLIHGHQRSSPCNTGWGEPRLSFGADPFSLIIYHRPYTALKAGCRHVPIPRARKTPAESELWSGLLRWRETMFEFDKIDFILKQYQEIVRSVGKTTWITDAEINTYRDPMSVEYPPAAYKFRDLWIDSFEGFRRYAHDRERPYLGLIERVVDAIGQEFRAPGKSQWVYDPKAADRIWEKGMYKRRLDTSEASCENSGDLPCVTDPMPLVEKPPGYDYCGWRGGCTWD